MVPLDWVALVDLGEHSTARRWRRCPSPTGRRWGVEARGPRVAVQHDDALTVTCFTVTLFEDGCERLQPASCSLQAACCRYSWNPTPSIVRTCGSSTESRDCSRRVDDKKLSCESLTSCARHQIALRPRQCVSAILRPFPRSELDHTASAVPALQLKLDCLQFLRNSLTPPSQRQLRRRLTGNQDGGVQVRSVSLATGCFIVHGEKSGAANCEDGAGTLSGVREWLDMHGQTISG